MSSSPKASSVVAQRKPPLPSSAYEVRAVVRCDAPLPRAAAVSIREGGAVYTIEGTAGPERADMLRWAEPPHRVFANLPPGPTESGIARALAEKFGPPIDAGAALAFIERYGVMLDTESGREAAGGGFRVSSVDLAKAQRLLRAAWAGDVGALARLQTVGVEDRSIGRSASPSDMDYSLRKALGAETAETTPEVEAEVLSGGVELAAGDVWSFICVLFLRDRAAGRLGVCECPECVAPFFLRKRRTQKYCEAGPCVAYAARRRALDWWRRNMEKRRAKRRAKARRR